jgi:hypothetical protein
MKNNMGKVDRSIRFIAAAVIIGLGIYYKSWFGLIGAIPLFTSLVGWCPLYIPFKISTIRGNGGESS